MIGLIIIFAFLKSNANIRTKYCLLQNPLILSKLSCDAKKLLDEIWDILEKTDKWAYAAITLCSLEAFITLSYLINIIRG